MEKAPDAFRTISEVAEELDVPQHVLRFWESRFRDIKPMKRGGGRRYYRPDDVDLLRGIRHLLYGEGYTIRGVQRILREQGIKFVQTIWHPGAAAVQPSAGEEDPGGDFSSLPVSPEDAAAERSRRLLSLLPSLLSQDREGDDATASAPDFSARHEPPMSPPLHSRDLPSRRGLATPTSAHDTSLGREDVRKLQATLHELGECRRMIEAALADPA